MVLREKEVPAPVHSGLAMIALMDGMGWKHLPNAGGLYDQHPDFIEKVKYYMGRKATIEKQKADKTSKMPRGRPGTGMGGRR